MRLQKIVIISTLVGLNFSSAFSQTERKSSEEFFRENSARSATDDKLAEILRKKQAELDAKEHAAPGARPQSAATSPAPAAVEPRQPTTTATPAVVTPASEDRLEEALRKKQAELDAKENAAPQGRPISQPSATSPKPVVAEPKPSQVIVAQPAVDAAAEDRLAEALRKKQAELDAKETSVPQGQPVAQPSAASPKPVVAEPKPSKVIVAQPAVDSTAENQLVEALRKKQAELDAKEPIATPRLPAAAATTKEREESEKRIQKIEADIKAKEEAIKKRAAAQPKSAPVVQPDVSAQKAEAVNAALQPKTESKAKVTKSKTSKKQAPEAPWFDLTTKEGRLAELLRRYKADEITPHDYHLERAKIIAEP